MTKERARMVGNLTKKKMSNAQGSPHVGGGAWAPLDLTQICIYSRRPRQYEKGDLGVCGFEVLALFCFSFSRFEILKLGFAVFYSTAICSC